MNAPTCPLCGTNDHTGRDRVGGRHTYLCTACWTVFDGSPSEWERMSEKRRKRKAWARNMDVTH